MKPFVIVGWHDAEDFTEETWLKEDTAVEFGEKNMMVVSGGFVISDTTKYLTLGADYDTENNNYGRVTKIPKGMIVYKQVIFDDNWPTGLCTPPDPT